MHHISNFKDIYFKNKHISHESVNNIKQLKKKNTEFFQNNYNEEHQMLDNESKFNILKFFRIQFPLTSTFDECSEKNKIFLRIRK